MNVLAYKKCEVLDNGFVELVDTLGSDLTVVNSARVSFGKRKEEFDNGDRRLVRYLAKYKHFSPFRHIQAQFHIKAPEFVMRQWYKHVVGIETSSNSSVKDHAWNEISGRYVEVEDYYTPSVFRQQSEDNKQATEGAIQDQDAAKHHWDQALFHAKEQYRKLLDMGVGKEQARAILPLNQSLVGSQVRARVAVVDNFGIETNLYSQATRTVENVNNKPSGRIVIRRVGQ